MVTPVSMHVPLKSPDNEISVIRAWAVLWSVLCFANRRTFNDEDYYWWYTWCKNTCKTEYITFSSWLNIVFMGWRWRAFHSDSSAYFRRPKADLEKKNCPHKCPPSLMSQCPVSSLEAFPLWDAAYLSFFKVFKYKNSCYYESLREGGWNK